MFDCPFFADQKRTYLPKIVIYTRRRPNSEAQWDAEMIKQNLCNLANFIKIILESVEWKIVIDCVIMYAFICVILYVQCNTFTVIFLYSFMWGLKNKHLNLNLNILY